MSSDRALHVCMAACRPLSDMHVDARQARAACGGLAALADEAARAAAAVPLLLERVLGAGRANDFYFKVRTVWRACAGSWVTPRCKNSLCKQRWLHASAYRAICPVAGCVADRWHAAGLCVLHAARMPAWCLCSGEHSDCGQARVPRAEVHAC